jgi:hypothetical protein
MSCPKRVAECPGINTCDFYDRSSEACFYPEPIKEAKDEMEEIGD